MVPALQTRNEGDIVANIVVSYTIRSGKIVKVDVVSQSFRGTTDRRFQRALISAIEEAAAQYTCSGDHTNITQPFNFNIR